MLGQDILNQTQNESSAVAFVCFIDNTRGAGELFPDTGGLGVGVPATPQRPGHSSAVSCTP